MQEGEKRECREARKIHGEETTELIPRYAHDHMTSHDSHASHDTHAITLTQTQDTHTHTRRHRVTQDHWTHEITRSHIHEVL